MVEGYMDVISMHQAGVGNVVASSGTSLTTEQIRLIRRFTKNITVLYDGDSAGIKASLRGIDMLLAEGMNVKVLLLPDGEDPDSYAQKNGAAAFQEYISKHQTNFIRFKTDLLLQESNGDISQKANLIKDIVNSIAVIEDAITRSVYIKDCSARLDVAESLLIQEVNKLRHQAIMQQRVERMEEQNDRSVQEGADVGNKEQDSVEQLRNQVRQLLHGKMAGIIAKERTLIRLLVRYGDKVMCQTNYNGQNDYELKVGEFIIDSLDMDQLELLHPVYKTILDLFKEHYKEQEFVSERFFMSYPDDVVNKTAVDLMQDKYQLNNPENVQITGNLMDLSQYVVNDYKYSVVQHWLKEIIKQLEDTALSDQDIVALHERYRSLLDVRNQLTKLLGNRVINL